MAVREELILDLTQALNQIRDLEVELDGLLQPIEIPVEIESTQALTQLQREIRAADTEDIDIDVNATDLVQAEGAIEELGRELADAEDEARDFARSVDRAGDEAESLGRRGKVAFGGLSSTLIGLGTAVAGVVGFRELAQFFGDSIDSASDLEESTSKAQVVFGDFFGDIEEFAATAPQALGLANSAALEFTGTFGNLFVALGLSQQAASDLAPEIVQLGADLASFNNLEVTDALDKLRAGLVGEAEPLRALGVNLTAATVEAKALELGLAGTTGEISEAAKVQARYALILEQTTTAQGDFARTSDGIANRQRTLKAEFENLRAEIGQALLPAFEALLDAAPALLEAVRGLVPVVEDLADSFAGIDFTEGIDGLRTFGNTASGVISLLQGDTGQFVISEGINDFNASVAAGIDEATAFEAVLTSLTRDSTFDLDAEGAARFVEELQGFADLDAVQLFELARAVREFGADAGLTEDETEGLLRALQALATEELDIDVGPNFRRSGRGAKQAFEDGFEEIVFDPGDILDFDIEDEIADLEAQFGRLPDALDAAAAALRDEENDIVSDFSDFLSNLEDELAAQQAFTDDIQLLRNFGLDRLAEVFETAGLDAAEALADAVANPEEAFAAEALLDAQAQTQAESYVDAFTGSISSEPITQALIDSIIAAAANADTPEIQAALLALAEALTLTIPVQFGDIPATPGFVAAQQSGFNLGANVGTGAPGGVTVNQTFNSTPSPTTETTRAAQEAAAAIRNIS